MRASRSGEGAVLAALAVLLLAIPARAHHTGGAPTSGISRTGAALEPGRPLTFLGLGLSSRFRDDGAIPRLELEAAIALDTWVLSARVPAAIALTDEASVPGTGNAWLAVDWGFGTDAKEGAWLLLGLRQLLPGTLDDVLVAGSAASGAELSAGVRLPRQKLDLVVTAGGRLEYGSTLALAVDTSAGAYLRPASWLRLGGAVFFSPRSSLRGDPTPRVAAGLLPSVAWQPVPWLSVELAATVPVTKHEDPAVGLALRTLL